MDNEGSETRKRRGSGGGPRAAKASTGEKGAAEAPWSIASVALVGNVHTLFTFNSLADVQVPKSLYL